MSAVKNLRAMFEQKGDSSPPDRGRSPGISHGSGSNSPARPLSKVRTSFVAIEKDGRMGLQRGASQDSVSAARKLSGDSVVTTPTTATERSNPFELLSRSPAKTPGQIQPIQPIFESPRPDSGSKDAVLPVKEPQVAKLGSPLLVATEPKKPEVNGAETEAISPIAATSQAATPNGTGSEKEQQKPSPREASKAVTRTPKHTPKPLTSASAGKPAMKPETSPTLARGPRTPVAAAHHAAKRTPEKKAQASGKPATPRATATSKPAGPLSIKRPPPLQSSPAGTGFIKPKVKSPTRPVKLPSSLTTHTASSGSKVNASRSQSLSRTSNTTLPADPHGRPASRASGSTAGSGSSKAVPTRGLRRQSSTINRPRPSLGPPPKQAAKDHPPTKREKEVDQGFLARMMRPTASSAQKTTGKVQTSPPRKPAAAPKKATTLKPVKKVAAKPTAVASSPAHRQGSTAEGGRKSSAQEVAPIAEKSEPAEQVSAIAKEAGDEAALPQVSEEPASEPSAAVAAEAPAANGNDKAEAVTEAAVAEPAVDGEPAATEEKKDDAPETTA